ncbi:unnamed protein product [Schistocephalus solidus]|uniref:Uncharacterized protein n=1 Tax=Schistocephalus solidus TaxID=70667 RepID=A0A3P7F7X6_SCHSO|nr:unnamed protein product [Schistocephalus solidus]
MMMMMMMMMMRRRMMIMMMMMMMIMMMMMMMMLVMMMMMMMMMLKLGTLTPWDPSHVWWFTQRQLRPCQPPASYPASGLLNSAMTLGSDGGGGESAVAAEQGYYHLKLIHAQVTVPAPPFRGAYGGHRHNPRSNYRSAA